MARAWQVDRPSVTPERLGEVESQMFDLFAQLGASDQQLDFQTLYASAREVRWHSLRGVPSACLHQICSLQASARNVLASLAVAWHLCLALARHSPCNLKRLRRVHQ